VQPAPLWNIMEYRCRTQWMAPSPVRTL